MSERRGTKALELWCRRMTEGYPDVKIDNMTTSWRNGLAFCALIHHFRPDLIDFDKLNKSDIYYNNALAFTTAEKYLGIPALLDADDMAAYEVPDRLSILTYLSQFYQVFAAQEAHNRLKRSSSPATDETQISKSSGPPSKMAHVVGVPKRDPCQKCQLPVFLAERLMVGKRVYHRTCLKCARCGFQLTPGSFYETEVDEQYCCETCPDEEVVQKSFEPELLCSEASATVCSNSEIRNIVECNTNTSELPVKSLQSSIKERLAFFENNREDGESDNKCSLKSLSDEDKSKSLQINDRISGTLATSYKPNSSRSNFLNNSVYSDYDLKESIVSVRENLKVEVFDTENDGDISLAPELPKTLPPLKEFNLEKKTEAKKRFSVSTQLELDSSSVAPTCVKIDDQENCLTSPLKENEISDHSSHTIDNSNNNNNDEHLSNHHIENEYLAEDQSEKETLKSHATKPEGYLEYSKINNNDCVTKDILTDGLPVKATAKHLQQVNPMNTNQAYEEEFIEVDTSNDEILDISSQLENKEINEQICIFNDFQQHNAFDASNKKEEETSDTHFEENVIESIIFDSEENIASNLIKETKFDENTTNLNKIETETKTFHATFDDIVPLKTAVQDNEIVGNKNKHLEINNSKESINEVQTPQTNISRTVTQQYPEDLNPFKSDDDEDVPEKRENVEREDLNPFDSSDEEVELEKAQNSEILINSTLKVPPPRPPPPRISKNPFGSEDEGERSNENFNRRSSLTGSENKIPVPAPRLNISQSQSATPEATPRLSTKINSTSNCSASTTPNNSFTTILPNSCELYGSTNSLYSNNTSATTCNILRNTDERSSNNSLNLSAGGTIRSRKSRRAPLPPAPVKELFPSNETISSSSKTSTPSSSTVGTPKSTRKKRLAPAPPKPARLEASQIPKIHVDNGFTQPKNFNNYPLQSELDSKLSDEEKALLEGKTLQSLNSKETDLSIAVSNKTNFKRLIPLDKELLEEHGSLQYVAENNSQCDDLKQQKQQKSPDVHGEEGNVVYRRILIPSNLETPTHEHSSLIEDPAKSSAPGERQMEKLKDNKEANNRNRQSQISVTSSGADDNDPLFNKSAHGKWKRRKGPAPALPVPPRKVLQMLPLQEIKHELEIIEVQQQGLEKQGVILEKMIRDRCEGDNGEPINSCGLSEESVDSASGSSAAENSKEVENLILQLFELVNEKNELFRRQAELMYLRRQHRLEQEQADLEYEIRILMAQPERNKTDSDKAREEALIERLVEIVQLRNEVVECLEMDRIREAEEDQSIKQRLESHIAKREENSNVKKALTKLSKKEKKKQKEAKKLFKSKKLDADKDADESEVRVEKQNLKKKKKLLIF